MRAPRTPGGRRDVRLAAIAACAALIALGGGLLALRDGGSAPRGESPPPIDARVDPAGHARARRQAEFDARFGQAVVMLHAKQYEHAATALHRLLELAPEVPEVHVNMGYAMLGLERHRAAQDFFAGAVALRPGQANAYYGQALSLAALGDLHGALRAMRIYVRLAGAGDPHAVKARAAIDAWQARIGEGK